MSSKIFPTAQDAETAFYEALERCDLEGMMAVWSEDDEIVCVHPGGARLTGQDEVRESWARLFAAGPHARVTIEHQVAISGMMLAVHSVFEHFTLPAERGAERRAEQPVPIIATNVYLRTAAGWRMIVHHASPAPAHPPAAPSDAGPKILH
ncbi:MAG TPA: nuclear transport factor 2 family protein [Burkholderiales bacterium]|nr:nuclear transport factor 2 family protein [Burkholderiales bacterium]